MLPRNPNSNAVSTRKRRTLAFLALLSLLSLFLLKMHKSGNQQHPVKSTLGLSAAL